MKKIGIVGAGSRGRIFADVIRRRPQVFLAGIADPYARPDWVDDIPIYEHHEQLIARGDLDAIVVTTPDDAHRDPVIAAAEAGLPIFVEKPFATTVRDGEAMAEAVVRNGVPLVIGFENRWNPHIVRIREALEAGELGNPVWQHAELSNTQYVPREMLPWAASSSPVWFLMPHTVDLVTWMANSHVTSVHAVGSRGVLHRRGIDTWDAVQALLKFEDGSSATLVSSWVLPESASSSVEFTYDFNGADGAVRADVTDQGITVMAARARRQAPLGGPIGGQLVGAPVWMMNSFLDSLDRRTFDGPGLREALEVGMVLLAIDESLTTGVAVEPSELPLWVPASLPEGEMM